MLVPRVGCLLLLLFFLVYYQRGFVKAHADDGLLEIFGLKQGWHASFVMVELILPNTAVSKDDLRGMLFLQQG